MAEIIDRKTWGLLHRGNQRLRNPEHAKPTINDKNRENITQSFSIPGLYPYQNPSIAIALVLIEPSVPFELKAYLPRIDYLKGEVIESLPKLSKFAIVLTQNLYEQTIERFAENILIDEFDSVYGSIQFSHNGIISKMDQLGIFLSEMSEDPNFHNFINTIPIVTTNAQEIAYVEQIKQIKNLNLMQINRNIAFILAALDKSGFVENLLSATVVLAIGICLEQKGLPVEDLAILNSENLSIEQLVNLISIYGITIEDYGFIESFVAYEGVFLIPQVDDTHQLVIPALSKDRITEIVWDDISSANPTFIYVQRDKIENTKKIFIHDPHYTVYGEKSIENSSKSQTSSRNPSTSPTLDSVISINIPAPSNEAAYTDNSPVSNEKVSFSENIVNASDIKAREDREKLETRVILSDEQLLIYLYGTEDEKRKLIQELSGIKPPKSLKSRVFEKLPEDETPPIVDVTKQTETDLVDKSEESATSDTNLLEVQEPEQERIIIYQDLENIEPIYQQILQNADFSPLEIAELANLSEDEIVQVVELADTFADLYNDL